MRFWTKSLRIFNAFCDNAQQSIRRVAQQTGVSTSSVHRLKQAMERRETHPESWWWETEAGRCWCIRLVIATLYPFGLKRGVGAATISEFFGRLHLETHGGCSPSALRGVMQALERVILETAKAWEHEGRATSEGRRIIGAADETFLERMMLVFMDLVSGYLLFEEVAEDRTSDTWHAPVEARLEALGTEVLYLVSDRAKALIKLAETGLECRSVPDLFPLIPELVKSYAWAIGSRLSQAQEPLSQGQASSPDGAAAQQAQALVEARAAEVTRWENVHSAYRHHLAMVSLIVHPWRLVDLTRQTSAEVERQWHAETQAIEAFIETNGLPAKKKARDKVRTQLTGVSALVDLWWQGVWHDVQQVALPPQWTRWVEDLLLPLLSWQEQIARTRCPRRKAKLAQVLEAVHTALKTHPLTAQLAPTVLEDWQAWAFQRAASAVEGRNGSLSQMPHKQRGLPKHRYKVWTVLHNFACRASDGTTPASRFFRREFPDLFETVLSHVEDFPRPRNHNQKSVALSG